MNYSPLRYPGGKSKLAPLVSQMISNINSDNITYIEPFAGGAGVALYLLINGYVDRIVINDYDKAIYSFWRAVIEQSSKMIELIQNTPITVEEWKKQKAIYESSKKYSVELGFAAFFLNRTNRSGILNAGPIGGYQQNGNYMINARFNKELLIKKLTGISRYRSKIKVYNKEIRSFINTIIPEYEAKGSVFSYFDPPYYKNGQRLYKNFFKHDDHEEIACLIKNKLQGEWIVTYDDIDVLRNLYKEFPQKSFKMNYSVAKHEKGSELLILKNINLLKDGKHKLLKESNIELFDVTGA